MRWFGSAATKLPRPDSINSSGPLIYDAPTLRMEGKKAADQPATQLWRSETYFREKYLSGADLDTFFDEYVAMFSHKRYDYSKYGIPELVPKENPKLITEVCEDHRQDLFKAGKETDRADLEIWVAQNLLHWMEDSTIPLGSKLITVSPRGTVDEGYPGTKTANYVFVNVYEKVPITKKSPTGFKLNQFTSYDTNYALGLLQKEFRADFKATDYESLIELPLTPKNSAHRIIGQVLTVGPETKITDLKTRIQSPERQEKNRWPFKTKDLPEIDVELFEEYRKAITEFCHLKFETLSHNSNLQESAEDFNDLIYTIRKWFLKWTEDHATNYQHLNPEITTDFPDPDGLLKEINEMWTLVVKDRKRETLTPDETKRLDYHIKATTLNPAGILVRASTMAHCVALTPASMLSRALNFDANTFSALKAGEILQSGVTLSSSEIKAYENYLQSLTQIFVKNRETDTVEIYYLHIFNSDHQEDYEYGCYKETSDGPIMGPCDVSLADDPLVDYENVLTEDEFDRIQEQLIAQKLEEVIETKQDLSPEERARIQILTHKICQKLFHVSLSGLIAGVMNYRSDSLIDLPFEYYRQLEESLNPLQTLEEIVKKLEGDQLDKLEEVVIYQHPLTDPEELSLK